VVRSGRGLAVPSGRSTSRGRREREASAAGLESARGCCAGRGFRV